MKRTVAELRALVANAMARCAPLIREQRIPDNLREIVAEEVLRCKPHLSLEHLREHQRLQEDLGFDELDLVALALGLEERLGLFVVLDTARWGRLADVVRLVARAIASNGKPDADGGSG